MKLSALLVSATLAACTSAFAAGEHGHDHDKGPNGGKIAEFGDTHVELVAKQTTVEVYLSDAKQKALAPTGYKGVAILTVGGKAQRIELTAGPDKLTGTSPAALPAQPKGVVQITMPNGKTGQAKF